MKSERICSYRAPTLNPAIWVAASGFGLCLQPTLCNLPLTFPLLFNLLLLLLLLKWRTLCFSSSPLSEFTQQWIPRRRPNPPSLRRRLLPSPNSRSISQPLFFYELFPHLGFLIFHHLQDCSSLISIFVLFSVSQLGSFFMFFCVI